MTDLDIIKEALLYSADLTFSMPLDGLQKDDGTYVKPDIDLVWRAEAARYRLTQTSPSPPPSSDSWVEGGRGLLVKEAPPYE